MGGGAQLDENNVDIEACVHFLTPLQRVPGVSCLDWITLWWGFGTVIARQYYEHARDGRVRSLHLGDSR